MLKQVDLGLPLLILLGGAVLSLGSAFAFAALRRRLQHGLVERQSDIETLRANTPSQFEELIAGVYRRLGYSVENPKPGADGGVDVRLRRDGHLTLVQCKHWKGDVGVTVVRELFGCMTAEGAQAGVVVTTGRFSDDARKFAQGKPLELLDGPAVLGMIREAQKGATQRAAHPTGEAMDDVRLCAECHSPMVSRTAQKGPRAGQRFWGCSRFPACRGTQPA